MPFTLAHPAAVLPFLRKPFIPIALVAGAIAPDLPYFAMVSSTSNAWYAPMLNGANSHDFAQILTVGLPLALAVAGFLWLVAAPLRWAAPDGWVPAKPAPPKFRTGSARIALWLFYSLMLGLVTHLAWDSLTHHDGWVVLRLPFLGTELLGGYPIYRLLQHLSSLAGLLVMFLWYLKRVGSTPVATQERRTRGGALRAALVGLVLLVPALVAAGSGIAGGIAANGALTAGSLLWLGITRGGAALIIAMAAYAVVWQVAAGTQRLRALARTRG